MVPGRTSLLKIILLPAEAGAGIKIKIFYIAFFIV
jgi:hypothetical protein